MNKYSLRHVILVFLPVMLANCAYKQESGNIESFINYSSLADVNKQGNYNASLRKEAEFDGTAALYGIHCSAHKYPYEFNTVFDRAMSSVLDKVYQTVDLKIQTSDGGVEQMSDVNIHTDPVNVRIVCHAVTEYDWECVSTTKLTGRVWKKEGEKFEIAVEKKQASPAGGACGGGAVAVSASIGQAIDAFGAEMHEFLVTN